MPKEDIVYTLSVVGLGNCKSSDEVKIFSLKKPTPPNTFTPNGDGINDTWEIEFLSKYTGCIVEVYTPQGQIVFKSVGYSTPWNGTYKGNPLPAGTYYYAIDPKNDRNKIAGYVTIFK
jgi:gliding motility-associated-like protein